MGKPQALVSKRIEQLPISRSQNKMYSDRLLSVLDKRVRNDPALFVFYRNGRVVGMDRSDQGISKFRSIVEVNKNAVLHNYSECFGFSTIVLTPTFFNAWITCTSYFLSTIKTVFVFRTYGISDKRPER